MTVSAECPVVLVGGGADSDAACVPHAVLGR